jgi:hypothetical protein
LLCRICGLHDQLKIVKRFLQLELLPLLTLLNINLISNFCNRKKGGRGNDRYRERERSLQVFFVTI